MNIFFLSPDFCPRKTAEYYVNSHCIKIITEINQCLASAYSPGVAPYKISHKNHPIAIWCRASLTTFNWAVEHCLALCVEYTLRYGKIHAGQKIAQWYKDNQPDLSDIGWIEPPQCFGAFREQCFVAGNPVAGYRNYYNTAKVHLFKWKNREKPNWIKISIKALPTS